MRLARIDYEPPGKGEPELVTPAANHSSNLHIFIELPDHLGSESLTIDHASGELVEARTYQPYGATESDYRPDRWKGFREEYGFTGKEEDVEVGLQYFGKRYLSPYLGRWISADPLAVHAPGKADLNLYAYVKGAVLKAIDPVGLECGGDGGGCDSGPQTTQGGHGAPADSSNQTPDEATGAGQSNTYALPQKISTGQAVPEKAAPKVAPKGGGGDPDRKFVAKTFTTWRAKEDAAAGKLELASIAEAGLGCLYCHIQFTLNRKPTDSEIDLANVARIKTTFNIGVGAYAITSAATSAATSFTGESPYVAGGRGRSADPGVGPADLPHNVGVPIQTGVEGAVEIPHELSSRQMAALMNTSGGIEFSQSLELDTGRYLLTRGGVNSVEVFAGEGYDWIGHTHPGGSGPSPADVNIMKDVAGVQNSSKIYTPHGSTIYFGPKGEF